MQTAVICLGIITFAAIIAATFAVVASWRYTTDLATKALVAATNLATVQSETGLKNAVGIAKLAEDMSVRTQELVSQRVKVMNRLISGGVESAQAADPIEDAPPANFRHTSTVDDNHEILRELNRIRREADEDDSFSPRDFGINAHEEV